MTELYLIAHKVRGEPAFDIAIKMDCPLCSDPPRQFCTECEDQHFWWIIPTSGHRAYPWRWWSLDHFKYESRAEIQEYDVVQPLDEITNGIPDDWPDHYEAEPAAAPTRDLLALLKLRRPTPNIRFRPLG